MVDDRQDHEKNNVHAGTQLTSLLSIDSQGSTYALRSSLRIVGCGRFALSS